MLRFGRFELALFAAAFVLRLAIAWATLSLPETVRTEAEKLAINFAEVGEYGNPYSVPTGPSGHLTPIYPLYLAALFSLFGDGVSGQIVKIVLACATSALRCALLPMFAIDAGLEVAIARLAGILSMFYIGALKTDITAGTNGAWLSLALLALVWASLRVWRSGSWKSQTPWFFFLFCGFSVLLDPAVLPVIAAFVLAGIFASPRALRARYLQEMVLLAATVLLVLSPWAIRNYLTFDNVIWTKTNFGLEFWLSNGPGRKFDLGSNTTKQEWHPGNSEEEAGKIATLGEVEYNRQKLREARGWIQANPGSFLWLTLQRISAWWFPPGNIFLRTANFGLTILALIGLYLLFQRQPLAAYLILLTWISFPVVYYVIQWSTRYRFPINWQLLLCASVAIVAAYRAFAARVIPPSGAFRFRA